MAPEGRIVVIGRVADRVADSIPFSLSQLLLLLIVRVSGFRLTRFSQIYADKSRRLPRDRAAEVRSAKATELPVWKRPPVSVANGLCHPWDWIPGQAELARDDTVYSFVELSGAPFHHFTFPPSKILSSAFYLFFTTPPRHHEILSGYCYHTQPQAVNLSSVGHPYKL